MRNFEVLKTSAGVLETVRLQGGFKYEFFLDPTGQLVVREVNPSDVDMALELLDGTKVESWGQQLPLRLQKMHSHWYCREELCVVLRRTAFYEREAQFMLVHSSEIDFIASAVKNHAGDLGLNGDRAWLCFRLPDHQAKKCPWRDHMRSLSWFDQLVLPNAASAAMQIFGKFETDPGVVHAYYDADGMLIFELPRYDLGFQLEESGKLRSRNFSGFSLAGKQQLDDALAGFSQYLILKSPSQSLLLIPEGEVTSRDGVVCISGPEGCDEERRLHVYEIHPRFHTLEPKAGATAIQARLQLAALYAAAGTEVPELRSGRTGGEVALELLRQSWNGDPMNPREQLQLNSIPAFGQLTPALPLLCSELDACARELRFLRPGEPTLAKELPYDADAATAYTLRKQRAQLNPRALLAPDEEERTLGARVSSRPNGALPPAGGLNLPSHSPSETDSFERALRGMLREALQGEEGSVCKDSNGLPLTASDVCDTQLGRTLLEELSESWSAHQQMPTAALALDISQLESDLLAQHAIARSMRERVERHLLECIERVPAGAGRHASAFVMRRAANLAPRATLPDLARASWEPETLRQFNPFLSEAAVTEVLLPCILQWLELCVLEDKLERMALLAADGNSQELERELKEVGRGWEPKQHPQWLVFEVEQRLQIRRAQYLVARFLIDNKGAITQLNMGEGKTRVILPMLVLELARSDRFVRLHFLSQLIDEAYYYLHRHLTASLMGRRLLRLPFDRDVSLSPQDVAKMHDCLSRCMCARGAVVIAPEHRLSLQLKWHELRLSDKSELVDSLPSLDALPYCDVLDESDEILHHRYQLIYAWGHNELLPAGMERWRAVQTMVRLLQTSPEVAELLKDPNVAKRLPMREKRGAGVLDDLRLLPGPALDAVRHKLNVTLARALTVQPPYDMRWLRNEHERIIHIIVSFVTEPQSSHSWLVAELEARGCKLNEFKQNQLLALRGLLAIGMLEHCLSRRHRVEYGVDERRGKKRRIAVPYRASDTPSERAECAAALPRDGAPDSFIVACPS